MDKSYLEKIEQAEKEADKILNNAIKEADKLKEDAVKNLQTNKEAFETQLDEKAKKIISDKIREANQEALKIMKQNEVACNEIENSCQSKIDDVVEFVINQLGDSKWQ